MSGADPDLRERLRWGYENPRPDVQELVPLEARRILDLGCSSGALGAAIKDRQGVEVVGIELDGDYAKEARDVLDQVLVGDVERLVEEGALDRLGRFDCLIAADVLEHLRDPEAVLAAAVRLLEPDGTAVISLPNVRYWETLWQLGLRGTWPRREAGTFDATHLRWFTGRDAVSLMHDAGLTVTRISRRYRLKPSDSQTERQGRWFARTPLRPFFVFQYVMAGVRRAS